MVLKIVCWLIKPLFLLLLSISASEKEISKSVYYCKIETYILEYIEKEILFLFKNLKKCVIVKNVLVVVIGKETR